VNEECIEPTVSAFPKRSYLCRRES
jgi:hypothetical protein